MEDMYCDNCFETIKDNKKIIEYEDGEREISVDGMCLMDVPIIKIFCSQECLNEYKNEK